MEQRIDEAVFIVAYKVTDDLRNVERQPGTRYLDALREVYANPGLGIGRATVYRIIGARTAVRR